MPAQGPEGADDVLRFPGRTLEASADDQSHRVDLAHSTVASPGSGTRRATLTMMFKLAQLAQKDWTRLNGYQHILHLCEGREFINGILQDAA